MLFADLLSLHLFKFIMLFYSCLICLGGSPAFGAYFHQGPPLMAIKWLHSYLLMENYAWGRDGEAIAMPTSTSLVTHTNAVSLNRSRCVAYLLCCITWPPFQHWGGSIIICHSSMSVTIDWLNVKSQLEWSRKFARVFKVPKLNLEDDWYPAVLWSKYSELDPTYFLASLSVAIYS